MRIRGVVHVRFTCGTCGLWHLWLVTRGAQGLSRMAAGTSLGRLSRHSGLKQGGGIGCFVDFVFCVANML
jgi:hypothetical protein